MAIDTKNNVSRICVSLPETLLRQLDSLVDQRGFESRSQAIARMINDNIADNEAELGEQIMAGVITLVYDHGRAGLQKELTDIQHRYLDEVISSLHVQLMHAHTMEVILVQGPVLRLQTIADDMLTCKGVINGRLQLSAVIIPPVHPLPERDDLQLEKLA